MNLTSELRNPPTHRPMKAAVCTRYGPPEVLQVREVDEPAAGRHDVLIRIHAAAVTASDVFIRSAIPSPAPSNLTHDEAAVIPYGALLALHFLRTARIQRGERVFVYGASGAVGTSAIQLARHFGGTVTAVCSTY